jgi:hypothetical protein
MRRYNYVIYDVQEPYFIFKRAFKFINNEPKLSDSMLTKNEFHESIV